MAEPCGPVPSVLIADDDALVRMVLRMGMEKFGYEVVEVSSAEEFGAALAAREFRLCIMDASIPGSTIESRLQLFDLLAPTTRMIVVSGYSEPPAAVAARGLPFMSKPIDLPTLTSAVATIGVASAEADPA